MSASPRFIALFGRLSVAGVVAVCALLVLSARAAAGTSAAARLADRYSPVIAVEPQSRLVVAAAVQWVLFHRTGLAGFVSLDGRRGAATDVLALFIGDLSAVFAAAAVTAAVSAALSELNAGRPVNALGAYAMAARNSRELGGATAVQFVLILLLVLSVIGIPVAVYHFIRTSLFAQACVLGEHSAIGSLRASARLTRRHWWRTFGFTALINVIAILSGPLLGVLILLLTAQSLTFIDITGSIVYALVVLYAALALTLYYFDLQARSTPPPTPSVDTATQHLA